MIFLHPEFLYYMLPVLIVLFGFLLTQKESQEHYFSQDVMDKLRVSANSLTLKARNALFFLVGVLLIVALAEPVIENGTIKVKSSSADIIIALDISDSMLAQDVYPDRLGLAKKKALYLLQKATKDRVGVIAFAKNSYLVSPLSFDNRAVSFLLSKLDTTSITQKGTNFLTMLKTVAKSDTNTDKKYLLILSDGGDENDFSREIAYAKKNSIVVYVLGMGTEAGAPIKQEDGSFIKYDGDIIISSLNEAISKLAIETGGTYIQNTTSSKDIKTMLKEIIDNSEHKELKSQEIQRYIALFYYPIALALIILLIALSSISLKKKYNLPASVFVLFVLMLSSTPSEAGLLDFMQLKDAKKLYDTQDYNASGKLYEEYAKQSNSPQAYYDAGNAYYKEKNYLKALSLYSQAKLQDKYQVAKKLSNMGNAFVRLGTKNTLEKALKYYEQSLKIKENKETREDLEAVKKALEKEKEKSKKNKKEKNKEKDKETKERKTDEQGDNQDKADKTKNKNKNSKKEDKTKKNKPNDNSKSDDKKQDNNKKSDEKADGDEKNQKDQNKGGDTKQQAKEIKDKTKKEETKDKNKDKNGNSQAEKSKKEMSKAEEDKWINKLNSHQNTYLYRLNEQTIENEDKNEKPW